MRIKPTNKWKGRGKIQSDYGYLLNNLFYNLTTNNGEKLLVHTGIFYDKNTQISGRTAINTIIK